VLRLAGAKAPVLPHFGLADRCKQCLPERQKDNKGRARKKEFKKCL
jgi:hypothetical protein